MNLENETLQKLVYDTALLGGFDLVNGGYLLRSESVPVHLTKMGTLWEGVDLARDMITKGENDFNRGKYDRIVDNIFWNSLVWGGLEGTGSAGAVFGLADNVPVVPKVVSQAGIHAGLKTVSDMTRQNLRQSRNEQVKYLTNISSVWKK